MTKKNRKSILFSVAIVLLVALFACNPAAKYEKNERDAMTTYLAANPNGQKQTSGLYYWETLTGTGRQPVTNDTVSVWYTGKFTNGKTFDSNIGKALLTFPLNQGIYLPGLEEGISLMKEGGKATILLPSNLGYGTTGYYTIPGYTPLVFDVQLVKVIPVSK